jgi:hypothetical protein
MTVVPCPSSGPISIANIKAAFPTTNSNNLADYRGKQWFKSDNSRGFFPSGANAYISMSMFYDTREITPVIAGSQTYTSGSSITLPALFNTLTVTVYGASGGGGGGSYLEGIVIYDGSAGSAGGGTSFGNISDVYYLTANGGGGGSGAGGSSTNYLFGVAVSGTNGTGANGVDGSITDSAGIRSGGSAGLGAADNQSHRVDTSPNTFTDYFAANGGRGGNGGKNTKTSLNISTMGWDVIKNYYGISVPISLGAAGSRGSGGKGLIGLFGGNGSAGYIVISWT